ncbi:hypothetical protein Scep_027418 [Stephania cephalantha]|uniref:Uncharacterized protein n=1 Tax=Stephania cephalantha TaxID=152367 RepID=A0AAP0HL25_9MAGN
MPSCLSTEVKLGRSNSDVGVAKSRVVAEETRNSPRIYDASSQQSESSGAAAEKGSMMAKKVASGGGNVGQRRKRKEPAAAGKGGQGPSDARPDGVGVHERRSAAREEKTAQRRRRTIGRSGGATLGVVRVCCRGRREPVESRLTSTMTVDDDGDGGGEDCAAAAKGFVGGGEGKNGLQREGTRMMGF